jgi:hypothetical protein
MKKKEPRRVILREEFVKLTQDFKLALLLQHILSVSNKEGDWLSKKVEDIIEDSMITITQKQMRACLNSLSDLGYLQIRNNPKDKLDRLYQYKINLPKLKQDLESVK